MRIRIKFAKKDTVRYLGHLDVMRYFQRCFNRAGVKMEYSAGYHPHQKMSFAQPLGVGMVSNGEYMEAEIADGQDPEEICRRLNQVCGEGFEVRNVKALEENAEKAMAALRFAAYSADVRRLRDEAEKTADGKGPFTPRRFDEAVNLAIRKLLALEHIPAVRTTKSGQREVDIRPQILGADCRDGVIRMTVTAGSDNHLKPDLLLSAIFQKTEIAYQRERVKITREELFADGLVPLDQFQCIS